MTTIPDPENTRPAASPFFQQWAGYLGPKLPDQAHILDLACGSGRLGRLFMTPHTFVTFVDIKLEAVMDLEAMSNATLMQKDLENTPWPFTKHQFDGVVVGNYLWRPNLDSLLDSIKPGGFILYETFGIGNEVYGRPKNPNFLLQEGELVERLSPNFDILEQYHGLRHPDQSAIIQNAAAIKKQG